MNIKYIGQYIKLGAKDKFWYAECQSLFEELYGPEKLSFVCSLFAATSINSSLKSNIRLFRKAMHEIENNLPFSNYLPVMKLQLKRIRSGESIRGRKISSFAKAMSGDPNAVVVDIWLLRAFEMDNRYVRSFGGKERSGGATDKQYDFIELFCREYADREELEARQVSSMIWSGVRVLRTGDRETSYKNILRHQLYNMFDNV